jgi:hypothetical protein
VVELTSKGDLDHGNDSLLEQNTKLTSSVDLGSEAAGSEVVLGTKSGNTLLSHATHHGVTSELQVEINTSLELSGKSSPVRTLDTAGRHELSAGNPVLALVLGSVADHGLRTHLGCGSLVDSLETEGESGSDALEVATDEDTSKRALEDGRVHGLDLSGKVIADVVVLEGELGASRARHGCSLDLGSGLCDPARSPSVVEAGREGKVAVKVTLAENLSVSAFGQSEVDIRWMYLVGAVEGKESVRRYLLRALGEGVRDLEQRRDTESLCEVGAQTGEGQVVEENIALDLLCNVLDGAGVAKAQSFSSCLEGRVCVLQRRSQSIVGDGRQSAGLLLSDGGDRCHGRVGSGGNGERRHDVDFCC